MRKKGKKGWLLFFLEIFVLVLILGLFIIYGQVSKHLDMLNRKTLNEQKIEVNPEVIAQSQPEETETEAEAVEEDKGEIVEAVKEEVKTGYSCYAMFGLDTREKNAELGGQNSDTMIVACVNHDTKTIRLVSLYRDTLLNIGNDIYAKANAAYAYGGPEQAITMLNTMMDLNISDYVTIDFNALVRVVDLLGGLDIPLSYAEIVHMNNYCVETSKETGADYTPIELPEKPENEEEILGTYHLNGVQVTSYCRIRYTSNMDMGRTERQRRVLQLLVIAGKSAGLSTISKMMEEVFPMVETSLTTAEILELAPCALTYDIRETTGFPMNYSFSDIKGSIIVCNNLAQDVSALHEFLFGIKNYVPSQKVHTTSSRILEIVANGSDEAYEHYASDSTESDYVSTNTDSSSSNTDSSASDSSVSDSSASDSYDSGSTDSDNSYESEGSYDSGDSYDSGSDYDDTDIFSDEGDSYDTSSYSADGDGE